MNKKRENTLAESAKGSVKYFRTALPICTAVAAILMLAGFIVYKLVAAYRYNEKWKDYDECGLT